MLQGVAQDAVEGQAGAQDLLLHPLVVPQVLDLRPQAVEVLQTPPNARLTHIVSYILF